MAETVSGRQGGLTHVEALVLLGILAVSAGLLLVGIQRLREHSFRTQCGDHLREIGKAFQMHHTDLGFFPSGGNGMLPPAYSTSGIQLVGTKQDAGWGFQILPWVEGTCAWNGSTATDIPDRRAYAIANPNRTYFCPARRGPTVWNVNAGGIDGPHAMTDYAASNFEGTGVVRQGECLRKDQVSDGLSCTLLVADKSLQPDGLSGPQPDDREGYAAGWDDDVMRYTDPGHSPNRDRWGQPTANGRFGSMHPRAFMAVFCDGSVHAIHYSIDAQVFGWLGNIADGNRLPVSGDW